MEAQERRVEVWQRQGKRAGWLELRWLAGTGSSSTRSRFPPAVSLLHQRSESGLAGEAWHTHAFPMRLTCDVALAA